MTFMSKTYPKGQNVWISLIDGFRMIGTIVDYTEDGSIVLKVTEGGNLVGQTITIQKSEVSAMFDV